MLKRLAAFLAVILPLGAFTPAMAQTVIIQPGTGWYPGAIMDSLFGYPCGYDYYTGNWICPPGPPARVVIERKWHRFDPRIERCPSYAVIDQRDDDLYCSVRPIEKD